MTKKVVTLLLSLILLIPISGWTATNTSANEVGSTGIFTDENGNYYLDPELTEQITAVYEVNGEIEEISVEQYIQQISNIPSDEDEDLIYTDDSEALHDPDVITPNDIIGGSYSRYHESSNYEWRKKKGRVSPIVENRCFSSSCSNASYSIKWSASQGHSFSVSLTSGESSALKKGVSYTWTSSASRSETFKITVKPGNKGWVEYDARMRRSSGKVKTYNSITGNVSSQAC